MNTPNIEKYYENKEARQKLKKILSRFSKTERRVVSLYFGLNLYNDKKGEYSEKEIAEMLDLTPLQVFLIIRIVLNELRGMIEKSTLKEEVKKQPVLKKEYLDLSFDTSQFDIFTKTKK